MNISHPILLEYYEKYQGGNIILPWWYYLWPGNWFKPSKKILSSTPYNNKLNIEISNDDPNINKINSNTSNLSNPNNDNIIINDNNNDNNIIYNIPSLVKIDLKLYNPKKGGRSKEIINEMDIEYNLKNQYLKNNYNSSNYIFNFKIIESNNKILFGAGTFTAVYKIKDNNKIINDSTVTDNIYILRLTTIDVDTHMYDNPKIHKEYELFNKYLPKIYYYGKLFTSNKIYYYTITKVYYDFSIDQNTNNIKIPNILSNTDKFVYFYNNLIMLNDLINNNYTHFDYKLTNIGFEIDYDLINVILIDYDEYTLQELSLDNKELLLDDDNVIGYGRIPRTYIPNWISLSKTKIYQYDKFATAGLLTILHDLEIDFKINEYNMNIFNDDEEYINELNKCKFYNQNNKDVIYLQSLSFGDQLHLNNDRYNLTPSYKFLIKLFSPIMENKEMYLL